MKRFLTSDNLIILAALAFAALMVAFGKRPYDGGVESASPHQEPRRIDWPALSTGPICVQINGTRRRYWHPFPGSPCDVEDAPAWPPGDFAFVIDYLLPQEEISNDRHFIVVPESDKP